MNKFSILFLFSVIMLLSSCNTSKKNSDSLDIPFTIANGYFLKNDADLSKIKGNVIKSSEVFTELFGSATVMGANGKPYNIDFSTQYIIPIIEDATNVATEIKPLSLTKKGDNISLKYESKKGEEQSFTVKPILLLVVNKADKGTVELIKE